MEGSNDFALFVSFRSGPSLPTSPISLKGFRPLDSGFSSGYPTGMKAIRQAGFKDVKIVEETPFPIDSITSDPAALAIIKDMNISDETIKQSANSILGVRVHAIKKA
jgi:hypothetical protein